MSTPERPFQIPKNVGDSLSEELEGLRNRDTQDESSDQKSVEQASTDDVESANTAAIGDIGQAIEQSAGESTKVTETDVDESPVAQRQGPWFEGRRDPNRTEADMTAAEKILDEKIAAEINDMLAGLDDFDSALAGIEAGHSLPNELRMELRAKINEIHELIQSSSPEEVAQWMAEAREAVHNGEALGPLAAGGNPAAHGALVNLGAAAETELGAAYDPTIEADERPSKIRRFNAPWAQAGAAGLAGIFTYFSLVITRPTKYLVESAPQVRDSIASGAGWVSDSARDYISTMAPNAIANLEATVISGAISTVIYLYRGERFRSLHPAKKLAYALALGSSVGLGLMKMQTSIKDAAVIAEKGQTISTQLSGMKGDFESIGNRIERLTGKTDENGERESGSLVKITEDSLNAEINDPRRPGYFLDSATFDHVYTGSYSRERFQEFMDSKGLSPDRQERAYEQVQQRLETIERLQEQYGIEGDLRTYIDRLLSDLNVKTPLYLYAQARETADEQAKSDALDHFVANFSPQASVTPESMDLLRTETIQAFIGLVDNYERITSDDMPRLESFARDLRRETGVDITDVIAKIRGEFKPLPFTAESLKGMLEKADDDNGGGASFKQDFIDMVVPDEQVLRQFNESIEKTGAPYPNIEKSHFWYYTLLAILMSLYLAFDLSPKPIQGAARSRSERIAREKLPGEIEKVNELEASITDDIVTRSQFAFKQFERALGGTHSPITRQMPQIVSELHVRSELRKMLGRGLPGADKNVLRKFRQRTLSPDKHFEIFNTYLARLYEFEQDLRKNPEKVTADVLGSLYPSIGSAIDALNQVHESDAGSAGYQKALKNLEREVATTRVEQLKAQAQAIEAHLDRQLLIQSTLEESVGEIGKKDVHALAQETVIKFDLTENGHQNFAVPRDVALEAYALTLVKNDAAALSETLDQVRALGIEIEQLTADDRITSPEFLGQDGRPNLEVDQAMLDQLRRTSMVDVVGEPSITGQHIEGTVDDFERFDEYMRKINETLRSLCDEVIRSNDFFEDTTPVLEWRLDPVSSKFTVFLELRAGGEFGEPAAILMYPGNIPDFTKSPEEASEDIARWFRRTDSTERSLIAQVENYEHQRLYEQLFYEFTHLQSGSTELPLIVSGEVNEPTSQTLTLLERLYDTNAVLKDQNPLMPIARAGGVIESTKFKHFTDPDSVLSPYGSTVLTDVLNDILDAHKNGVIPENAEVVYNAATERIEAFRPNDQNKNDRAEQEKVLSVHVDHYARRELLKLRS